MKAPSAEPGSLPGGVGSGLSIQLVGQQEAPSSFARAGENSAGGGSRKSHGLGLRPTCLVPALLSLECTSGVATALLPPQLLIWDVGTTMPIYRAVEGTRWENVHHSLLAPCVQALGEEPCASAGAGVRALPCVVIRSHVCVAEGGGRPPLSFSSPGPTPRCPGGSRAAPGPRQAAHLGRDFSVVFTGAVEADSY